MAGDPEETLRIRNLNGFVDGQTTNPLLVAKNPDIIRLMKSGHKLSEQQESDVGSSRNQIGSGERYGDSPLSATRRNFLYDREVVAG